MAETPDVTDASPSPFRRFPWVQLVFCVACLTMTAWTWMRYSYAWPLEVGDGPFHYGFVSDGGVAAGVVRSTYAHYAEVRGLPSRQPLPSDFGEEVRKMSGSRR